MRYTVRYPNAVSLIPRQFSAVQFGPIHLHLVCLPTQRARPSLFTLQLSQVRSGKVSFFFGQAGQSVYLTMGIALCTAFGELSRW